MHIDSEKCHPLSKNPTKNPIKKRLLGTTFLMTSFQLYLTLSRPNMLDGKFDSVWSRRACWVGCWVRRQVGLDVGLGGMFDRVWLAFDLWRQTMFVRRGGFIFVCKNICCHHIYIHNSPALYALQLDTIYKTELNGLYTFRNIPDLNSRLYFGKS